MKLPRIETCSQFVNFLRPVNETGYRYPQTASKLTNMYDAFINRLNGFEPVELMGINKRTNAFVVLRDWEGLKGKIGRKFVNWVKYKENKNSIQKNTLSYSGSHTETHYTKAEHSPILKMHNNKNFFSTSKYENGKVQMIEKMDKKKDFENAYSVYERNAQGKLEKVFEGEQGQYQLQQIKEGKDPNPFRNSGI